MPFVPDFDDTGPLASLCRSPAQPTESPEPIARARCAGRLVHPVAVPGRYQYVKWWKLLLVILGVWFAAAEVGLSLFYWWYHTIDKTAAVYMVLVYVVVCAVAG